MTNSRPSTILNDVLSPVMRGPSSSSTAGPYFIGRVARSLLGEPVTEATFAFDAQSNIASVFRAERTDLGLAAGTLGWDMTDERFLDVLDVAAEEGVRLNYVIEPIAEADHPTTMELRLTGQSGRTLTLTARSIGGGSMRIIRLDGWRVELAGDAHELLVECRADGESDALASMMQDRQILGDGVERLERDGRVLLLAHRRAPLPTDVMASLRRQAGVRQVWASPPVFMVPVGRALFASAAEMMAYANKQGLSLGPAARRYEAMLLGLSEEQVDEEMRRRWGIMLASMEQGFRDDLPTMQLLQPTAQRLLHAHAQGTLPVGGTHALAAARAMAVMQSNSSSGVVVAAPTGGAAGIVPAVLATLAESQGWDEERVLRGLWAAGGAGLIVANRATFTASVGGCQVEVTAAGAMAAAGVVEMAGGSPQQACDAAAIMFQNQMGLVCDPVQGVVEIPCHTRNAATASSAYICAELALAGYVNHIPLDEVVDAMYAVGRIITREVQCTAERGCSACPSAKAMPRLR